MAGRAPRERDHIIVTFSHGPDVEAQDPSFAGQWTRADESTKR